MSDRDSARQRSRPLALVPAPVLVLVLVQALALCAGAGCFRLGFGNEADARAPDGVTPDLAPRDDAPASDTRADASPADASPADASPADAPSPDAAPKVHDWSQSPPSFSAIVPLTPLNTSSNEANPFLDRDHLTLYFMRSGAIYVATRPSRGAGFGPPSLLAWKGVNTGNESALSVSADGKTVLISSSRPGGKGATDLWTATRATSTSPLSAFSPLTALNTANKEFDPFLTDDGLTLWFVYESHPGGAGKQDIYSAARSSPTAAFGTPQLSPLSTAENDGNPILTADQRTVVFTSCLGGCDLYYATRKSKSVAFSKPTKIPSVNTSGVEAEPFLSDDGLELFFIRDKGSGAGWDLHLATVKTP